MFSTSVLTVAVTLLFRGGLIWTGYLVIPIIVGAVCALIELYSKNGVDTITCPLSALAVMLPLLYAFGGLV